MGAMLTQIYEVTSAEEAAAISEIGVDRVGVLVGDGSFPREQSVSQALRIAGAISTPSKLSALFLSSDLAFVNRAARKLQAPIVHLGAVPELVTPAQVLELKRVLPGVLVMRSVPVTGPESIATAWSYDGIADFVLLDSYREGDKQIGALGVTHDWSISRQIVEKLATPVILAGGLGPGNVADAIRAVRPAGVDSKTRTDKGQTHTKDLEKVRLFHAAVRAASL
jgi:phosphoribosylanthranilate isomerase